MSKYNFFSTLALPVGSIIGAFIVLCMIVYKNTFTRSDASYLIIFPMGFALILAALTATVFWLATGVSKRTAAFSGKSTDELLKNAMTKHNHIWFAYIYFFLQPILMLFAGYLVFVPVIALLIFK
jgi:hypothetical protein